LLKSWRRQRQTSRTDGGVKERIQSAIRERNEYKTPIDQNGGKRKEDQLSEPAVMGIGVRSEGV
jgi:hypothetical protein